MSGAPPRVVVVGAGFGGLSAARALRHAPVEVVLLDRRNYHLFQPLLYQVATAGLTPGEIAYPVRAIFRRQRNLEFRVAEVTGIDLGRREVETGDGAVRYDYLVLAIGAETDFFGLESVRRHAFGLKDVDDAVALRNHVLTCFERAAVEREPSRRRAELTFAVAGGGPTGVETAGALSELIRLVLARDFTRLDLGEVRVVLVEASPRLLPGMPDDLSAVAVASLGRKRVEVWLGTAVEDYDGERVRLAGGETLDARTLVWAAGARAAGLAGRLSLATGRAGRIRVDPTLELPGHAGAFVIGDAAYLEAEGAPFPMMAPVAMQMGDLAARNVVRRAAGQEPIPFRYRDPGSLATIGRNSAGAYIHGLKFRGFAAWVVWLLVHLIRLIGFRNRIVVLVNWAWDYFFYESAVRLITRD
ncbi:MAG: NAD(P)/FAD-dependent oxidoreductase [Acidobacteriia bacterium]|nr:NAD(P)/FAD-dependent oxidoreductase [Terriglobia bacterium]